MPSVPHELDWPEACFECGAEVVGLILCCGVYRCVDPCHINHERSALHQAVVEGRLNG